MSLAALVTGATRRPDDYEGVGEPVAGDVFGPSGRCWSRC